MIQKSYEKSEFGKIYLIPTPIGNFDDMTLRGIEVLKSVDIVYAEDTRETLNLLKHFSITKKVESCHKYTEKLHIDKIVSILKSGKNIGYVTDRGTPLISDPGNIIVDGCIEEGISVIALPGANALLPAINMSGLSNRRFLFYGFLDSKKTNAKKELIDLKEIEETIIFYEAPHRILETLNLMLEVLGDRKIAIVREISKLYEEVNRDKISNIIKNCDKIKGEIVIVVEGYDKTTTEEIDYKKIFDNLIKKGYSKRDAIREISEEYNINKNKVYDMFKE